MVYNDLESGHLLPNTRVIVANPASVFDQAAHWQKKYGSSKLQFVSHNQYLRELQLVATSLCATVLRGQEESLQYYDEPYNIIGAIIFGSFARGLIHQYSDIDAYALVTLSPGLAAVCGFADQVKRTGVSRELSLDKSFCVTRDLREMRARIERTKVFIGKQIVVSPYPDVIETVARGCR